MYKELTIQEKAKAYDEAIKRAKGLIDFCSDNELKTLEFVFPELKESEDAQSKKWILEYLYDGLRKSDEQFKDDFKIAIAWLKKQGEQKSIWHNEDEEPKRDSLILLIMQSGTPIVAKIIEPNHTFNHGERWAYIDDLLEKQGEKPQGKFALEAINEKKVDNADKVESKFHEGDWVIDKQGIVHQIANVVENVTNHTYGYDIVGGGYFNDNNEGVRLWTIQDAKDGDVLFQDLMDGKTFIYNGINPDMAILYSFIISNDGKDVLPYHIGKPNTGIGYIEEHKNIIHPATKEQRNLLFQKMKEAGYKLDENFNVIKI